MTTYCGIYLSSLGGRIISSRHKWAERYEAFSLREFAAYMVREGESVRSLKAKTDKEIADLYQQFLGKQEGSDAD